jgi:hypothetical protein
MDQTLRCDICGSTLALQGALGLSCPRCLLSLASEPESQNQAEPEISDIEKEPLPSKAPARTIPR